jgi:hypothetical protein
VLPTFSQDRLKKVPQNTTRGPPQSATAAAAAAVQQQQQQPSQHWSHHCHQQSGSAGVSGKAMIAAAVSLCVAHSRNWGKI